jgi:ketosteroid isomerase-like protein
MLLQHQRMSKIVTPEDLLNSQVEEFNKGNINFLMTLYEKEACFASKPGQVVKDLESIRRTLLGFIDMGGKLEAKVKRVLQANNLALLITEWSINGTEPDGTPINLTGRGTVVLRQQPDGTWLMVIENPWGTD